MILHIVEYGTYKLGESPIMNPIFISFDYDKALKFLEKEIKWYTQNNNYEIKEDNYELEFICCINISVYHYKLKKLELVKV